MPSWIDAEAVGADGAVAAREESNQWCDEMSCPYSQKGESERYEIRDTLQRRWKRRRSQEGGLGLGSSG